MAKSKANARVKIEPGWLDKQAAAAVLGVKERQFDSRHRKMIRDEHVRMIDHRPFFYVPAIVAALVDEAKQRTVIDVAGGDPMMLAPGDSPALERWRNARADTAEIERDLKVGSVVDAEIIHQCMVPALRGMRGVGERLRNEFGNAAADIFNEGIDEFGARMLAELEKFRPAKDAK